MNEFDLKLVQSLAQHLNSDTSVSEILLEPRDWQNKK